MEIKSVNAPAISEEGLRRLYSFCAPKRMTERDTLFKAGYEQAKRDFKEKLEAEAKVPAKQHHEISTSIPPQEITARRKSETKKAWWDWN